MNYKKYIAVLAVFIGVSVFAVSSANATHSWSGYHWARTSNPFELKLGDNVSSAWDSILATTSTDWTKSVVLNTTIVTGGTSATKGRLTPKNCVPTSGRVEVCNAQYGNTGWLGVAQIWASGTHIIQGTVKANDTYFNTPAYNTTAWRNLVMCQEVGHTLGLDHQDENFDNPNLGTCMDYTSNPESNQHPNQHDYDELVIIYGHNDSTTTVGQTTSGPGNHAAVDGQEMADWGKSIRTSSDGKQSLFERELGNGEKLFTFVIWAR